MSTPIFQKPGWNHRARSCGPLIRGVARRQVRLEALVHGHYPGWQLPRNALPGLKTVGFWDATYGQDWGLDWHRDDGIELTFLETGQVGFGVDQTAHRLKPGSLAITRPWQLHRVGDPHVGAGRLHWLILDVAARRPHQTWRWPDWVFLTRADLHQLTQFLRNNEDPVWQATPELRNCFERMGEAIRREQYQANVSRLTILLNELFLLMLEMFRDRKVELDETLTSSLRTVDLFWKDLQANPDQLTAEWTIAAMARRCDLGTTQFIHLTKRLYNLTPVHCLSHHRLSHAVNLLRERPAMNVAEVAMACGFSSGQYFAKLFRDRFGCTPTDYRSQQSR